jgi:trehalose 6-phosphate synthase
MQFWHIPWPAWDTYRACPNGTELLRGLLGNDVLGFHTTTYRDNFLECVETTLPDATIDWQTGEVSWGGEVIRVVSVPLGVPTERIQRIAGETSAESFRSSFREQHEIASEIDLAVGVDRLDYAKGLPPRLKALMELWEKRPDLRGAFTYVQNASESRSKIPAYQRVEEEVTDLVGRINRRFGTDDWQPIVYLTDTLPQYELYALYRHADLALVTSIRDGMNLVAKEYVAAQVDEDGVLVLSGQTGATDDLGEYTLTVSPFDVRDIAEGIETALAMPPGERQYRMRAMRGQVAEGDLDAWLERQFALAAACKRTIGRQRA